MYNLSAEKAKKRIKKLMLVIGLFFCVLFLSASTAMADNDDDDDDNSKEIQELQDSISEKQKQIDSLEKQKKELQAGKTNIQNVVNSLKASKNQLNNAITELDQQVSELQANIDSYNTLIEEKEAEIEVATKELEEAERVAAEQYEAMKLRIKYMYEKGENGYLEILLASKTFGDFLNKADYIEKLSEYDRNKLQEYALDVEYVTMCGQQLEEEKAVLEEAKQASEEEQDNLDVLISEKEKQITAYDADINTKQQAIAEYDAEIQEQTAIIEAVEAQVAAQKAQLDEATRRHYDGGIFCWPAPSYTRISDEYGWRLHPTLGVQKLHNGIDMAAPGGSPILAAYDGEVVTAAYSSSCGNYIMIDHGDGLYTVYMHASALYVSKGDTVTKGQKIAAVGSTGRSTGNHLHFGVRKDGQYVNPRNYL